MGKPKNNNVSVKITISTHPRNCDLLDWLIERGPYGNTHADAVDRILGNRLQEILRDEKEEFYQWLKDRKPRK